MMPRKRNIKLRHLEKQKLAISQPRVKRSPATERAAIHTANDELNEVAAAAFLNRSISTLQNRRSLRKLPKYKHIGRDVFYDLADLEEYKQSITRTGTIISE
jgi:hypothetical protein